jgi:hypothetical protein
MMMIDLVDRINRDIAMWWPISVLSAGAVSTFLVCGNAGAVDGIKCVWRRDDNVR